MLWFQVRSSNKTAFTRHKVNSSNLSSRLEAIRMSYDNSGTRRLNPPPPAPAPAPRRTKPHPPQQEPREPQAATPASPTLRTDLGRAPPLAQAGCPSSATPPALPRAPLGPRRPAHARCQRRTCLYLLLTSPLQSTSKGNKSAPS